VALIIGPVETFSAPVAQGAVVCGHSQQRHSQGAIRTQRQKLHLLKRRGRPTRDHAHRLRPCKRSAIDPPAPSDPPPANDPPPASEGLVPNGGPGGAWKLEFHDEFSGDSLNPAKWKNEDSTSSPTYGPQGGTAFEPSNVSVSGGHAELALHPNSPYAGSPHSGARIDTFGRFSFTYGYLEFRARMPNHDGSWTALWTNADSHPGPGPDWPANGEFDVAETLGNARNPLVHVHKGATQGSLEDRSWRGGGRTYADADTAWHTYAMDWESSRIRFYYDGSLVCTYTPVLDDGWIPDQPHHVIVNMQAFGADQAPPGADVMRVDYVRVWQR
jgi:beta-glucanase (GH16 family)